MLTPITTPLARTRMHARARNHWGISSGELIRDKRKRPSGELWRRTRGERHFATGPRRDPRNLSTVATANKRALHQLSRIARKVRPIENPPADPAKYTGKSDQASYRCRGDLLFGSYLDQIENVAQGRLEPR